MYLNHPRGQMYDLPLFFGHFLVDHVFKPETLLSAERKG